MNKSLDPVRDEEITFHYNYENNWEYHKNGKLNGVLLFFKSTVGLGLLMN